MKYNLAVFAIIVLVVFGASYLVFNLTKEETGLCKDYPAAASECKEAIQLAVEKYSGEVYSVDRIDIGKEVKYWIIGITLTSPFSVELKDGGSKIINMVEISVDENKNIGIYKMI